MYLQFHLVKEPSKNHDIWVGVLFGFSKTWVLVRCVLAGFGFFPISKSLNNSANEKSAQRRRKHCALAVVRRSQKFSSRRRPVPGEGAGRPKFNQLEMVTAFTYKPSLMRIDARYFELSW